MEQRGVLLPQSTGCRWQIPAARARRGRS